MPESASTCRALPALKEEIRRICRDAWQDDLLWGRNGNASVLLPADADGPARVLITRSGSAKGRLSDADFCVQAMDGTLLAGSGPSSEGGMHLAVCRAVPDCRAVLHVHPRLLLALSLRLGFRSGGGDAWRERFLRLPLFESEVWRARLGFAPALPPGSTELADAVADAARDFPAVWMDGHGLCCRGATLGGCLDLAEQLEHLAAVQLAAMEG